MNTNNISMWEVQLKITYEDYKLDNDRAIILHQLVNKFSANLTPLEMMQLPGKVAVRNGSLKGNFA